MNQFDRITPSGTKDYLFEECKLRRRVEGLLRSLCEQRGYYEVITTSLEFYDVFSSGVGKIPQEQMFTMTDREGRLVVMRPDSTKPVARVFASRLAAGGVTPPVRLYYNQSVFRRNIALSKRLDERMQLGVELIGAEGSKADAEALLLAGDALTAAFGDNFVIELGHKAFLTALLNDICADNQSKKEEILSALSSRNYPMLSSLADQLGERGQRLKQLPRLFGGVETLALAKEIFPYPEAEKAAEELQRMLALFESCGLSDRISLDFAVANDFNYYTGIMFKGFVRGQGREVLSGGRYDTLYGDYGISIPAVGFAFDVDEAVSFLLKEPKMQKGRALVLVYANLADQPLAYRKAEELKKSGVRAEVSLFDSLEQTLSYAQKRKAQKVLVYQNGTFEEVKPC